MKVTATGVSEATALRMFVLWRERLVWNQEEEEKVHVCFISENENGRT